MKSRVLTAFGLMPFVLGALFCTSPLPVGALALAAGVICVYELWGLLRTKSSPAYQVLPFACVWILLPLLSLVALHQLAPRPTFWDFRNPILLAVIPLWGGDTAAYFAGRTFGRHLLAPKISPKKTVEGAVGNFAACVAVAVLLGLEIDVPLPLAAFCGLFAGVLGQAGDLFESWIKRQVGAKDSGTILPGHGGLLDRLDSLLFTAPAVYCLMAFAGHR